MGEEGREGEEWGEEEGYLEEGSKGGETKATTENDWREREGEGMGGRHEGRVSLLEKWDGGEEGM